MEAVCKYFSRGITQQYINKMKINLRNQMVSHILATK